MPARDLWPHPLGTCIRMLSRVSLPLASLWTRSSSTTSQMWEPCRCFSRTQHSQHPHMRCEVICASSGFHPLAASYAFPVALQESLRGQYFSTDGSTPTASHTSLSGPPTLAAWLASLALLTLSPWAHVMANCSTCLVATLYLPPLPPSGMVCVISRTMTVAVGVGALMPPCGHPFRVCYVCHCLVVGVGDLAVR